MEERYLEAECPCTHDCPRHGDCVACAAHHKDRLLPACRRPEITVSGELLKRVEARMKAAGVSE